MGRALQVITGQVTAPSTTFTAWTMAAGDSLTIRNCPFDARVQLLSAWADNQAAGTVRVRSPRLHDNVQGIRLGIVASTVQPLLPDGFIQRLFPQDTLVAEQTGSAVAADIETGALLVWYENLPGVEGRFIDVATLRDRMEQIVTIENTLALGTAGGYSGEEAINAEFDLLIANRDYALLGYLCSAECAVVGWRGADTGNVRVGGPGCDDNKEVTRNWFVTLSEQFQLPLIPVFNSANKAGFLIDGVQDENGTDVTVTSIVALLAEGTLPTAGSRR